MQKSQGSYDGDVLKHKWSFGDNASSVAVNPGHTYAAEGIYSLRLKVSDGKASAVKTQEIKIPNNPPVPDFEIASRNLMKLKFKSKASDPESDAVKVKWNFGDGKTSTALNPGHTYAEAGTYTVTLSVNDGYHASVKKSMEVTVKDSNHEPEAGFAISKPKSDKMYVKVVSAASDADNDPLKYRYDFGDNTASTAENPGHTYKIPGTYTITQKVSDGTASATYEQTVTVRNELSADFAVTSRGLTVTVEPAAKPDGETQYRWSFGDGTVSEYANPSHTYDAPGTYEITLTVKDGVLPDATKTQTITVERKLPFKLSGHVGLPGSDLIWTSVCLDINRDFVCSENEPEDFTDTDGNYAFDIYAAVTDDSPFACAEDNSCSQDALPITVIAYTDYESFKSVHGTDIPLRDDVVMSMTSFVPVSAIINGTSAGTAFNINPFTTITDYALKDLPQLNQLTLGVIYAGVLNLFGLTAQDVTEGTNKALITGEIASRSGILPNNLVGLKNFQESAFTTQNIFSVVDKDAITADIAAVISSTDLDDDAAVANAIYTYSEEAEYSLIKLAGHNADDFKCGISKTRNVYCWGNNSYANLGNRDVGYRWDPETERSVEHGLSVIDSFSAVPVKVKISDEYLSEHLDGVPFSFRNLGNVISLDTGHGHVCASTADGGVYCWGYNSYGQAGQGIFAANKLYDANRVLKGQQETAGDYLAGVASVTLGYNSSCALTLSGEVYCWGENTAFELGASHPDLEIKAKEGIESRDGIDMTDIVKAVPIPVKVVFPDTVSKVRELTAGVSAFCALTENASENDRHNVYCWGNDTRGLVSHNWMQYQNDWLMRYANKTFFNDHDHTLADPEGAKPWTWKVTEDSGEFHFLYGQPVTQVREFTDTTGAEFDLSNVTRIGINIVDAYLIAERDNDGELWSSYNYGTADNTGYWRLTDPITTFNGEKIAKLDVNAEDKVSFVLSDKGNLYGYDGFNRYGVFGIGSDDPDEFVEWGGNPVIPVYGTTPLTGVVDVSVGKRSVCAAVKRSGGNTAYGTDTYCWGSSTFGQLGFDNQDGGFSYADVSDAWSGKDSNNEYYDKQTRMVTKPRKIE